MIKSISLIKKKPGLTDEEFYQYWKGKHGPLAAKVVPGLRKYVQNYPVRSHGVKYDIDGIVEIWFDDLEACQRYLTWRQSDEAKVLLDDANKFSDISKSVRYIMEEHVIK